MSLPSIVRVGSFGLLSVLLAAMPVAAQTGSEVTLDFSPQLFTLLCATRLAGETPAVATVEAGEVGVAVRRALRELPPEQAAPLKDFFRQPRYRAGQIHPYISAALVMGRPPDFEWRLTPQQLPPDVYDLKDLPSLLKQFYLGADLAALWREVRPAYERVVIERQREVSRKLLKSRGYLRLIGESYPGRAYVVYVEWLVPPGLTSARNYGENYFLVIHPENPDFLEAVRHQYLHFLLDPIVAKYAERVKSWATLLDAARQAPRLPEPFHDDLSLLVTESLIQAVELRLQETNPVDALAGVEKQVRSGYIFTRYFYRALRGFEEAEPSFRYYYPDLVSQFEVERERRRLAEVDFLPPEEPPASVPLSPPEHAVEALLLDAQEYMAAGEDHAARRRFEKVLAQEPNEPRALYGLAILASRDGDREEAKRYFLRVLEQGSKPHILGWSHVYLGRIYDLEGRRREAVAHYRAALALNTDVAKVNHAARQGLERPFGQQE